ncbi:MAG TPA: hypothetical protein VI584_00715, partial [Nitrospiria bacterium]|nr:hypothetical protein [Nitrospiria bacterium]
MKGASSLFKALFGGFWVLLLLFSITMQSFAEVPTIQWTRQFGDSVSTHASGVSVDASGVYVAGDTQGTLPGQTSSGGIDDTFVRKYDLDGNE